MQQQHAFTEGNPGATKYTVLVTLFGSLVSEMRLPKLFGPSTVGIFVPFSTNILKSHQFASLYFDHLKVTVFA